MVMATAVLLAILVNAFQKQPQARLACTTGSPRSPVFENPATCFGIQNLQETPSPRSAFMHFMEAVPTFGVHASHCGSTATWKFNGIPLGQSAGEGLKAPGWTGFGSLIFPWKFFMSAKDNEGESDSSNAGHLTLVSTEEEPSSRPSPNHSVGRMTVSSQIYVGFLDTFEACGDSERALAMKIAMMSRMPGHRSEINRAYREAYPS